VQIVIEEFKGIPMDEQEVEIVERKGLGHPDTICDAVMESISVALCKAYIEAFDNVLHHNIDKGLLVAGRAEKWFGGGRLLQPMKLIIGDRAATGVNGRKIPVAEIAIETAREWFGQNLRCIDPCEDVDYRVVLAPPSEELADIFARPGAHRGANDTSAAIGYWPLSPVEETVLDFETWLNSVEFKERFPESGEDVKVMGVRQGRGLNLTVAMPLMCPHIGSEEEYFARKARLQREMIEWAESRVPYDTAVHFNTLDAPGRGLGGVYLSLLGTSAEDADSGQVGRGNRVNGLIAVNRPIGTEAVAGKNPVSHVGKIYNVLAHKMARTVFEEVEGLREVQICLVSRIGTPIDQPTLVGASLLPRPGADFSRLRPAAEAIIQREILNIEHLCRQLIRGAYPLW
jgi:S-adenosylmethionine synthetase